MIGDVKASEKICAACHASKPASTEHFEPQKLGKFGLTSRCRPCQRARYAELRQRPDQKARQQAWRDANKDVARKHNENWRAANTSTAHVAKWRSESLEHARQQDRERARRRRREDVAFLIKGRISARLYTMLTGKAGKRTEAILGYSAQELCRHIERQFTAGMTWDKLRSGEIQIDHILPVSVFNITSEQHPDFHACWGLANLRPMWAVDNRRKGGKVLTLL